MCAVVNAEQQAAKRRAAQGECILQGRPVLSNRFAAQLRRPKAVEARQPNRSCGLFVRRCWMSATTPRMTTRTPKCWRTTTAPARRHRLWGSLHLLSAGAAWYVHNRGRMQQHGGCWPCAPDASAGFLHWHFQCTQNGGRTPTRQSHSPPAPAHQTLTDRAVHPPALLQHGTYLGLDTLQKNLDATYVILDKDNPSLKVRCVEC